MPFKKGERLPNQGGYRANAGRPTKEEKHETLTLLQALAREEQRRAARIAKRYYDMADEDPATMRHVVDGVRPRNADSGPALPAVYNFIQFNNNSLQLPSEKLSSPVLIGDGTGTEETGGDVKVVPAVFAKRETWTKK